jgi:hypothetical protein
MDMNKSKNITEHKMLDFTYPKNIVLPFTVVVIPSQDYKQSSSYVNYSQKEIK